MDKPKMRPVEAFPIEREGQTYVGLRDPSGLAPEPIMLGMGAYFIASLFDGATNRFEIRSAFANRFGERLDADTLDNLIDALDHAHFLESPGFAEHLGRIRREFAALPQRPAIHAGGAYESDPERLRAEIEGYFEAPGGPGPLRAQTAQGDSPAGLIAPHIDPRRGGPVYAHAYAQLLGRSRPELIIILGTSHYGEGPELFSATRKNYETPLGAVTTDNEFLDRVASHYTGGDLYADELLHRNEHSIEFQALFLAWALGTAGYAVVPILVSSFYPMIQERVSPGSEPRVRSFIDAIGSEIARERRRVLVISGVDFAHVGRKFGDDFAAQGPVMEKIRREDRDLISQIERGDAEGFFDEIAKDGDQRKICGVAPIYTQLALLQGHRGSLLKYDIALEPETESAVTFASAIIK